ncbi:MAG: SufD family Fe-S cluster assembly protein [Candidatus Saganbacteria bacterium]|nr:SufD family Fe-S cluster assembly protein [Candidatus Saganbacteria bacterium]
MDNLEQLPEEVKRSAELAGIDTSEKNRSGSFFQQDNSILCAKSRQKGVEVLAIEQALEKHDWLKDYYWKAVDKHKDEYTMAAAKGPQRGYFLRTEPGVETTYPLQSCLFIGKEGIAQRVHNIIIAEEDSHLHVITGCAVNTHVKGGSHIGISEFYVKKNASITFTMVHNWAEDVDVRPRSAAHVAEGGTFINNYICMRPVKALQMYPTIHLLGRGARASSGSIIMAKKNSLIDIGFRVFLKAEATSAETISRVVARDSSKVIARGHLVGEVPGIKAHLECRGLVLSPKASIHAIPELEAKQENLDMSHEAAVGKIAEKEILYLMSRGLSEDEATSAIIRGFLKVDIKGLPEKLKAEVDKLTEMEYGI